MFPSVTAGAVAGLLGCVGSFGAMLFDLIAILILVRRIERIAYARRRSGYFAATWRGSSNKERGSLAGSNATSIQPLIISSQVCSP